MQCHDINGAISKLVFPCQALPLQPCGQQECPVCVAVAEPPNEPSGLRHQSGPRRPGEDYLLTAVATQG